MTETYATRAARFQAYPTNPRGMGELQQRAAAESRLWLVRHIAASADVLDEAEAVRFLDDEIAARLGEAEAYEMGLEALRGSGRALGDDDAVARIKEVTRLAEADARAMVALLSILRYGN